MKTDFELVEERATELGIGAHKWYGSQDETKDEVVHDTGKGEPIVLRLFEFKLSPTLERLPTKEEILTPEYIKHLSTLLWADSLRLVTTPEVRIDKENIRVFAACQARTGQNFLEETKLIQELL